MLSDLKEHFKNPKPFLSRTVIDTKPFPVPYEDGIYGLYFKDYPKIIHDEGTYSYEGYNLLYIGISPSRSGGKQKLDGRLKKHLKNDASRSTFRTSMGCLLSDQLHIQLQKYKGRISFGEGEAELNKWLDENLRFTWFVIKSPWLYEEALLKEIKVPLNLQGNQYHSFHPILTKIRKEHRQRANQV